MNDQRLTYSGEEVDQSLCPKQPKNKY